MPNASAPLTYAQGVVAASGTSVALTAQPSDNTHTILVTNPSATIVGLIGQATAPAPLTAGLNAQRVAPGSTVTLGIGTISDRGAITDMVADSIGGAVTLEVTYENKIGGPV